MELKTKIQAEEGRQELIITREFDLPVELLFRAYEDPRILEQWMGTQVICLENHRYGQWRYETAHEGQVVFAASGVILEFEASRKITRTFEMENGPLPVQLEFFEFEALTPKTSKLTMQLLYKSVAFRDQQLQMPFAKGLSWAHDRLETTLKTLNPSI
ncbi:SRPBCC family protein [Niabella terrae]